MGREVVCADALEWLPRHPGVGAVVTSLPDAHELGWPLDQWAPWFAAAARACLRAAAPGAGCVFYQTDRKAAGRLHSKAGVLLRVAAEEGAGLLWHKIVLRRGVGATDLHRPGYSHLLAFSRGGKPGPATPDVLESGRLVYPDAMGAAAALVAVRFALRAARTVCDPFCGWGTVLAAAESLGGDAVDAVGVDIDPAQCDRARRLTLPYLIPAPERARAS